MMQEEGLVVRGRVEIDTRRPFRSVREAVTLFGEKILAGETLKQMQMKARNEHNPNTVFAVAVTTELEGTKQSLEKAKEEENVMANILVSLRRELEETKRELHQMKAKETTISHLDKPEIEELKFVESMSKVGSTINVNPDSKDEDDELELNKKRTVKFASPPMLAKVIVSKEDVQTHDLSKKKIKRKTLVPLIGGLFLKKKESKNGLEQTKML